MRSRTPTAKAILAEVEKRLAYLNRRRGSVTCGAVDVSNPQLLAMHHETLGAIADLEAVRDMIRYRRKTLLTNACAETAHSSPSQLAL